MEAAKKILIVDDEPDAIAFLCTWLEDNGYTTCSAMDGEQGMQVVQSDKPDLILLDLQMPGQTGIQLYRDLQKRDAFKRIPVIFITGMTEIQLFGSEGAPLPAPAACFDKPINLQALHAAIRQSIGP